MKILFIGDVVGSLGREAITEYVPKLKKKYRPQVTIINGENAAAGRGITEKIYKGFLQDGADVITLGNHAWDNREIFEFIADAKKLVRPVNFPAGTPGVGIVYIKVNQVELAVINLQARTFMVALDDPFTTMNKLLAEVRERTPFILLIFTAKRQVKNKHWAGIWMVGFRPSLVPIRMFKQTMLGFYLKEQPT